MASTNGSARQSLPPPPEAIKRELDTHRANVRRLDEHATLVLVDSSAPHAGGKRKNDSDHSTQRVQHPHCTFCNNRHDGGAANCRRLEHVDDPYSEVTAAYERLWDHGSDWGEPGLRTKWKLNVRNPPSAATHFVEYKMTPTPKPAVVASVGSHYEPSQGKSIICPMQNNDNKNLISVYIVTHQAVVAADQPGTHVAARNIVEVDAATEASAGAAGKIHVRALADSRAIHGSYISTSLANRLRTAGITREQKTQRVCSFNKVCTTVSSGYVVLSVVIHNLLSGKKETIPIPVQVINNLAYDMIIGRPQLQAHKLQLKWNLDDLPIETLKGFCTSHDPNLRALCGIDTGMELTKPPALSDNVCGECDQGIQNGTNLMRGTGDTSYECCASTPYKCIDCRNDSVVAKFRKKCTDCTQYPCAKLNKAVVQDKTKPSDDAARSKEAQEEAARIKQQMDFEAKAKELSRTRRSRGNDLTTLDGKVPEQPIQVERRSSARLHRYALATVTSNDVEPSIAQAPIRLYHGQIFNKEELFNLRPDEDGYEYKDPFLEVPVAPWDEDDDEFQYNELPTKLNVSEKNKIRLDTVIARYSNISSTEVSKEPATGVAPFELSVDENKWQQACNRRAARPLTPANNQQIRDQLRLREARNVIRVSQASAWSQVHMVPKPDTDTKRMTIDFRGLNEASSVTSSWPIPNIDMLLGCIMLNKPRLFFKIDLTSGYHQFPLASGSTNFTAFVTAWGLFEWLRVPMGLKAAASFNSN